MIIEFFVSDICPKCPQAKELANNLGVSYTVKVHNVLEPEGLARASLLSILSTPSVVITSVDEDEVLHAWEGTVPTWLDVMAAVDDILMEG